MLMSNSDFVEVHKHLIYVFQHICIYMYIPHVYLVCQDINIFVLCKGWKMVVYVKNNKYD